MTFTDHEYSAMSDEMERSAVAAAPIIPRWLVDHAGPGWRPERVIDVGCGPGWWGLQFAYMGATEVLGVDGPDGGRAIRESDMPTVRYQEADLSDTWINQTGIVPTRLPVQWQLALCLEVGEHLPAARAESFVMDLRAVARVVVFSAAIPGQGGVGHVNERWPDWWASMFREAGWSTSGAIRRHLWDVDGLAPYYPQNMFVAWEPGALKLPYGTEVGHVDGLVHPGVWSHVTGRG